MDLIVVQGKMRLAASAAAAWGRLVADVKASTGVTLTISEPGGAYRSDEMVLDMWRNPERYGATKGTAKPRSIGGPGSVHENGLCVDIWNWAALVTKTLDRYAAAHGFRRTIAAEPWHYQHNGVAPAGGGRVSPLDLPRTAKGKMMSLYHKQDTSPTLYALAGDSPGTPANWQETTDQTLANQWSAQIGGPSAALSPGSWDNFKAQYLAPLSVASVGATVGGVKLDGADVVAAIERLGVTLGARIAELPAEIDQYADGKKQS